jgi:hypothetical protein
MSRGNQGRKIFEDDEDRKLFLEALAEGCGKDLVGMAKGSVEKQVLAWWLRKRTVVSRGWVSRRLGMGDESRVTQAVAKIARSQERKVTAWRKTLERIDS